MVSHAQDFLNCHPVRRARTGAPWTWGYQIYRTVYTPESDEIWQSVMSKLDAYLFREIDECFWETKPDRPTSPIPDPSANQEVRDHFRNEVVQDKMYNNLPINMIRQIFDEYLTMIPSAGVYIKDDMCLMIDEEVLHSIRDAPWPSSEQNTDWMYKPQPFIKAINRYPYFPEVSPEATGPDGAWMKKSIRYLFGIYYQEMEFLFPLRDPETGERDPHEGQPYCCRAESKIPRPDPSAPFDFGARLKVLKAGKH